MQTLQKFLMNEHMIEEGIGFADLENAQLGDDMIISCTEFEFNGATKYCIFVIDPLGLKDTERYDYDDEAKAMAEYKKIVKKHKS